MTNQTYKTHLLNEHNIQLFTSEDYHNDFSQVGDFYYNLNLNLIIGEIRKDVKILDPSPNVELTGKIILIIPEENTEAHFYIIKENFKKKYYFRFSSNYDFSSLKSGSQKSSLENKNKNNTQTDRGQISLQEEIDLLNKKLREAHDKNFSLKMQVEECHNENFELKSNMEFQKEELDRIKKSRQSENADFTEFLKREKETNEDLEKELKEKEKKLKEKEKKLKEDLEKEFREMEKSWEKKEKKLKEDLEKEFREMEESWENKEKKLKEKEKKLKEDLENSRLGKKSESEKEIEKLKIDREKILKN